MSTAISGGTANALTIPPLPCSATSTVLMLTLSATNTTTTPTLQMVGGVPVPIVKSDGTAVNIGELEAGSIVQLVYTGSQWRVMGGGSASLDAMARDASNATLPTARTNLGAAGRTPTNATLATTATSLFPQGLWRDNYSTAYNSGPLFFAPLVGTCVANSLINDGGSCTNNDSGNSWKAIPTDGIINPKQFGARGDGSTNDTSAVQAAFTSLGGGSGNINFPNGNYILGSVITYTATVANTKLVVGGDSSKLTWGAAPGGIAITISTPSSIVFECYKASVDITTGLDLVTTVANGGNAVSVTVTSDCTNAAGAPLSTINVRTHGDYESTYWTCGVSLAKLSNVNITNVEAFGGAPFSGVGDGICLTGTLAQHAAQINITGFIGTGLNNGIVYGNYVEGVTVNQSDFTAITNGCGIKVDTTAGLGLQVLNSNFGLITGTGASDICINSAFNNLVIANNFFIPFGGHPAIRLGNFSIQDVTISGNQFLAGDLTTGSAIIAGHSGDATISTNRFATIGNGIEITNVNARVNLTSNDNTLSTGGSPILVKNTASSPHLLMPVVTDVRLFNARCDGTTNDAAAFNTAGALVGINQIGVFETCRLSASVSMAAPLFFGALGQASVDNTFTLTLAGMYGNPVNPFPGAGTIAGYAIQLPYLPTSGGGTGGYLCRDAVSGQVYVKATCP